MQRLDEARQEMAVPGADVKDSQRFPFLGGGKKALAQGAHYRIVLAHRTANVKGKRSVWRHAHERAMSVRPHRPATCGT